MRTTAVVAVFLSFTASALAYQVTSPTATSGWTTGGPNVLSWTRVSTDALNFTAVLVNQDRSILPTNNELLAALVDGTSGTLTVSAPSGGWPTGSGFQVNLVQSPQNTNTILAQSAQFNITQSSTTSSSSSGSPTGSNTGTTMTATSGGDLNPTSSDTSTSPTKSSGAVPALGMQSGFVGAIALLGAFLA